MKNKKISISDAEFEVLRELWENPGITARQLTVLLMARTDWSEPTIKTLLLRLLQKNAVCRERAGKVYSYRALIDKEEYRCMAGRSLLDRMFNGIAGDFFTCLVNNKSISREEIDSLRELLDRMEQK